jgi:uncharacterized Zn finger protein
MAEKVPASVTFECPECGEETLHRTLKGRYHGKRLNLVLRCGKCGKVRDEVLEPVGRTGVRMIVSRGDESERTRAEFPVDWVLRVGDEFMHGDERLMITGIESAGARVEKADVGAVQTLWTKNFDQARVFISINRHGRTRSLEILTDPDEEFEVGSEIDVDGIPVTIHSIKVQEDTLRRGVAAARDIVRIYCTDARFRRQRD